MSRQGSWDTPHIKEDQPSVRHHQVVADLVVKYTPEGGSVLDLGCGIGDVLALLRESAPSLRLTGADSYEGCLERTRRRVPDADTLLVDVAALGREKLASHYDTIVMCHVLEHMLRPADVVLSVLKRCQALVLAVPNPARPEVLWMALRQRDYTNRGHVYAWDASHWRNFLERILELRVAEYRSDDVRVFPGPLRSRLKLVRRIESSLSRIAPWWSFSNIAVVTSAAAPPQLPELGSE